MVRVTGSLVTAVTIWVAVVSETYFWAPRLAALSGGVRMDFNDASLEEGFDLLVEVKEFLR
jgi:uncharacterized membrane protein